MGITHESRLEDVAGHEDLVGGADRETGCAILVKPAAATDLDDTVQAGGQYNEEGGDDRFDHDGAAAPLDPIQAHDSQFPQWVPEHENQNHRHLREYQREEELYHCFGF